MEEKRQKLEDFHPQIEKETVFRLIHCYPDSSVYEDMEDSFQEMQEEMCCRLCHPVGVMAKGRIPAALDPRKEGKEREVIFVLVAVGQEISDYSTRAFQKGDCVEGMLADAMADAALFSLEIQKALREACAAWHLGILKRLEAPRGISYGGAAGSTFSDRSGRTSGDGIVSGIYVPTFENELSDLSDNSGRGNFPGAA